MRKTRQEFEELLQVFLNWFIWHTPIVVGTLIHNLLRAVNNVCVREVPRTPWTSWHDGLRGARAAGGGATELECVAVIEDRGDSRRPPLRGGVHSCEAYA